MLEFSKTSNQLVFNVFISAGNSNVRRKSKRLTDKENTQSSVKKIAILLALDEKYFEVRRYSPVKVFDIMTE